MSGIELLPFVWALPLAYFAASYGKNGGHLLSDSSSPEDHPAPESLGKQQRKQHKQYLHRVYQGLPGHWTLDNGDKYEDESSLRGVPSANHHGRRRAYLGDDEEEQDDAGLMTILFTGSECMCLLPYVLPENTHKQP